MGSEDYQQFKRGHRVERDFPSRSCFGKGELVMLHVSGRCFLKLQTSRRKRPHTPAHGSQHKVHHARERAMREHQRTRLECLSSYLQRPGQKMCFQELSDNTNQSFRQPRDLKENSRSDTRFARPTQTLMSFPPTPQNPPLLMRLHCIVF